MFLGGVNAAVKDLSHGPITLVGKVTREHAENYPWTGASSSYYIDVEGTVPEAGDIDELKACNPRDLREAGFLYRMDSDGKCKVRARFDVSPEIYRRLQKGGQVAVKYYPHTTTLVGIDKQQDVSMAPSANR